MSQITWVQIPTLYLPAAWSWTSYLNLMSQFSALNGDNDDNNTYLIRLWGLGEFLHLKHSEWLMEDSNCSIYLSSRPMYIPRGIFAINLRMLSVNLHCSVIYSIFLWNEFIDTWVQVFLYFFLYVLPFEKLASISLWFRNVCFSSSQMS